MVFLLLLGLLLGGCGKTSDQNAAEAAADRQDTAAMGRYVENCVALEDGMGVLTDFRRLSDGRLAVWSMEQGPFVSADEGKHWEPYQETFWNDCGSGFFQNCIFAPDGSLLVHMTNYESGEIKERVRLCRTDGSVRELEMTLSEPEYLNRFYFMDDGRLLLNAGLGTVYEVNQETGELTRFLEADEPVQDFWETEQYLIAVFLDGVQLFEKETQKAQSADPVLDEFLNRYTGGSDPVVYSSFNRLIAAAGMEDGSLLLATRDGIFRHMPYSSTLEQLTEGSLYRLGDPSVWLYGLETKNGDGFLVMMEETLCDYSYDAAIPTVPGEVLQVYSLQKDDRIRQAVSLFQQKHPELYVQYTAALEGENGQTVEDAVKALNTELIAGNGPDVLFLNGLPLESYLEKGMLLDVTDVVEAREQETSLFSGMMRAFGDGTRIQAVPVAVRMPVMVGDQAVLERVTDLESWAEALEEMRKDTASGTLLQQGTPENVLQLLAMTCAPAWTDAQGKVQEEEIRAFLEAAVRIYQAERAGLSEEEAQMYQEKQVYTSDGMLQETATSAANNALAIGAGLPGIGAGSVRGIFFDFENVISAAMERENGAWQEMPGQSAHVFEPTVIAGVSARTEKPEAAKEFLSLLLSEEYQSRLTADLPVNENSLREQMDTQDVEPGEVYGEMGISGENGVEYSVSVHEAGEADVEALAAQMQAAKTPYLPGSLLEETVLETGSQVLRGEKSVEEGCAEILAKVRLQQAE